MARRRGFLAEIQHQARATEQRQRAAEREQQSAAKRAERELRKAEIALAALVRANEADKKRLKREAAAAHVAAKQAEVDALNSDLKGQLDELEGLLIATLDRDDFVDLETLRVAISHPPFEHDHLRIPTAQPEPIPDPVPPTRSLVPAPKGIFGRKRKLAEAKAAVEAKYAADYALWQSAVAEAEHLRSKLAQEHAAAEEARQLQLELETSKYEAECESREREAIEQNHALDELITGLSYGVIEAVEDYIGIVLANSVYPEGFPVTHSASFQPSSAELQLKVIIPGPEHMPTTRVYKYVKARDEITATPMSQREIRERYASIVHSVALRSLHEIFEADRRGLIRAMSLELGTETLSPATGRETYVPFVSVATEREPFELIDLSAVVPAATLVHLGAVVSKNPYELSPASGSGVRRVNAP